MCLLATGSLRDLSENLNKAPEIPQHGCQRCSQIYKFSGSSWSYLYRA